jgi:hypothetical protein
VSIACVRPGPALHAACSHFLPFNPFRTSFRTNTTIDLVGVLWAVFVLLIKPYLKGVFEAEPESTFVFRRALRADPARRDPTPPPPPRADLFTLLSDSISCVCSAVRPTAHSIG